MEVKIKKLVENATIPSYAKEGDAGLDLTATSKRYDRETNTLVFGTGLAVEIPKGFVGLVFPRSSVYKQGLALSNSVGVIDSGYRGEIMARFYMPEIGFEQLEVGTRIAQLVILPYPKIEFKEVDKLSKTDRGSDGFGSTGK